MKERKRCAAVVKKEAGWEHGRTYERSVGGTEKDARSRVQEGERQEGAKRAVKHTWLGVEAAAEDVSDARKCSPHPNRGLGTARRETQPRACARGPARSLADPRGTRLPPWHRKKMSGRCLVEDDDDLAPRRGRNSDSISEKDSSRCRDVGADKLQRHPKRATAYEAVLEGAARSSTLSPPHWRRAARSGPSLRESPSP